LKYTHTIISVVWVMMNGHEPSTAEAWSASSLAKARLFVVSLVDRMLMVRVGISMSAPQAMHGERLDLCPQ